MKPMCEIVVQQVMPAVRAILATSMAEKGMKGKDIASALKITPAAVTHYLKKARGTGTKLLLKNKRVAAKLDKLSENLAAGSITELEALVAFCDVCKDVRSQGLICDFHKRAMQVSECDICMSGNICR